MNTTSMQPPAGESRGLKPGAAMKRNPLAVMSGVALLLAVLAVSGSASAKFQLDPEEPGGSGEPYPKPGPEFHQPANGFYWYAPNRYYDWGGAWHERGENDPWREETYLESYVNPTQWMIYAMGCRTEADWNYDNKPLQYPKPKNRYRWTYAGQDSGLTTDCRRTLVFPAEGIYPVTMEVYYEDGTMQSWNNTVKVQDYLIVVLGDSSASGEGAPDFPLGSAGHEDDADWIDDRCHRSANSGGAQAARRIEDADSQTSVTFISLACSGATLNSDLWAEAPTEDPYEDDGLLYRGVGMLGPYCGIEPNRYDTNGDGLVDDDDAPMYHERLLSQVDALRGALTNDGKLPPRKMDALIVAGGINDARFADLAAVCVLYDECWDELVGPLGEREYLDVQFANDLEKIGPAYAALDHELFETENEVPLQADVKLALEYPAFFHDEHGDECFWILDDSIPTWIRTLAFFLFGVIDVGWIGQEITIADQWAAPELNKAVKNAAEAQHWTFVDTIADRFFYHGICASDGHRFINKPTDSAASQGNEVGESSPLDSMFSMGTAHPNVQGYSAYADEILKNISHLTENLAPVAVLDHMNVIPGLVQTSTMNVLANDYDPDPDDDNLAVRPITFPSKGEIILEKDGLLTYKSSGSGGSDSFLYEVSDGEKTAIGRVDIFVSLPVFVDLPVYGGSTTVIEYNKLVGVNELEPPYIVEFPNPPKIGTVRNSPEDGKTWYTAPTVSKAVKFELPYVLRSNPPRTGDAVRPWQEVRGIIAITVKPPTKSR